jgi:hypothetical protein
MQAFVGGTNAILLLLTVVFTGSRAMIGFIAWRRKNTRVLRTTAAAGAVVLGVYAALLLSAALVSKQRILAAGEVKWFCGFYLDCHLGVSVVRVQSAKNIQGSSGEVVANGVFKIVTVEFHNSARNQSLNMTLYHPRASVVDAQGRWYQRDRRAEEALARNPAYSSPVEDRVSVSHAPLLGTMAFDISPDATNPRLSIEEGYIVDRILELVLVNDDNSIFHKPTFLALGENSVQPPTSYIRGRNVKTLRVRLASR